MTPEVERALAGVKRRILVRRALVLASALLPVGCGAALMMLLSLRSSAPEFSSAVLTATLSSTLALIAGLTWWTRPSRADAARALDAAHGPGDFVLAATSPRLGGGSRLEALLERAAQGVAAELEPATVVALPSRRGVALGAALLVGNVLLAAMPPRQVMTPEVEGVQRLFAQQTETKATSPTLAQLRRETQGITNKAELRDVLDRHWNENRRERIDALVKALTEALNGGARTKSARRAAEAAAKVDLSQASPELLGALAVAIVDAIERGELPESLGEAEDANGAVAGVAAALGSTSSNEGALSAATPSSDAVEDVLIAAYSVLGDGPPDSRMSANAAEKATSGGGGTIDDAALSRFAANDREILRSYLERRAARK